MILNLILTIVVILIVVIILVVILKGGKGYDEEEVTVNEYSLIYLAEGIKNTFNDILKTNVSELNLNKYETEKRERNKSSLRKALRTCSYGDTGSKDYIKDYIKDLLNKTYNITEETIDQTIPFNNSAALTPQDKFEIILHIYKKKYSGLAVEKLFSENNLTLLSEEEGYIVKKEKIEETYRTINMKLEFVDKLEILAQKIYQMKYGHGCIDELRDMKIDGILGGVSGVPYEFYSYSKFEDTSMLKNAPKTYDSIWLFFQGKKIHLSFLSFGNQRELERVCKNIYKYNKPGILSETKGYIVNDMKDGSRVAVIRPNFSASWAFLVRKFDNIKAISPEELLIDKGKEDVITLLKNLIRGCLVCVITGKMGSGKTTLMKSLITYVDRTRAVRVHEQVFELWLSKIYPDLNIISIRETNSISGQEGLDFLKKSDGDLTLLGEIASADEACRFIQIAQNGSEATLGTNHCKTTDDLIKWFRTALCRADNGGYSNEKIAEEDVVAALNFDIHYGMIKGHRFIERITEIIPLSEEPYSEDPETYTKQFYERVTRKNEYKLVNIMEYEDGQYIIKNNLSRRTINQISNYVSEADLQELMNVFKECDAGE